MVRYIALGIWAMAFYFAGAAMIAGEWWQAVMLAVIGMLAQGVAWA